MPYEIFELSVNNENSSGVTTLPSFELSLKDYDAGDEFKLVLLSDIFSIHSLLVTILSTTRSIGHAYISTKQINNSYRGKPTISRDANFHTWNEKWCEFSLNQRRRKFARFAEDAPENTYENITSSNETEVVTEKSLPILKDDVSSTPEKNTSENITLSNETEVVTEKSLPNFKDEISSTPHNTQSVTSSNETEVVAEKGVPILEDEISQTSKNCSFIKKQFNKLLKHVKNTGSDEKEDARNSSLASSNSAIETNTSILRAESVHSKTDDNDDLTLVSTIPPIQMVTRNTDIAVSGASNKTTKGPNNESTEKAFSTTEGMFPLTTMITLYGNDTTIIVGSSGNATESPFYIATRRMLNSSNAPISTTLEKPINLGKYFRAAVNDNPPVSDENPLQATIVSDEPFDVLSPSGSSFSCVTSGFFKDPEDRSCTKYFFCAYKSKPGKFDLYQMRCPEFHQFNVQEQTCVMKQQPSCPTIRKYCERYGRYPDPEDYSCRKYISCFEDFASLYGKIVECPQNMQYNVLQRSCTKERQQGCPLIIDNINQVPW
uniref:Chitin-binding type-2 domain-containing protein n=1 Tax=Megaselia scalaris TaxID=36166 RepID=T1GEV9_MEGSC